MAKVKKELKEWTKEKEMIPKMILTFCKGNHKEIRKSNHLKRNELCSECNELKEYALFRLEKCPFKINKNFCSCCKVHCYKPNMKEKIRLVMRYSGPRLIFTHPIYAIKHVAKTIKHKKEVKKNSK